MKSNIELIELFESGCKTRGFAQGTIRPYVIKTRSFVNWLDGQSLLSVDENVLEKYINYLRSKNLKVKSMNNIFDAIGSMFSYLKFKKFIKNNPVPDTRKYYLRIYKDPIRRRQLISNDNASKLINSFINSRDRAIVTTLFKTGVRIQELCDIDLSDIDWNKQSIHLKPKPKRSNRIVFFDNECATVLQHWIRQRETWHATTPALFIDKRNNRIKFYVIEKMISKQAARLGLHDPKSKELEDKFTPHCCRHWFTTILDSANMKRSHIQVLRGDVGGEAIDRYIHHDLEEIRKEYLESIPRLGIRA